MLQYLCPSYRPGKPLHPAFAGDLRGRDLFVGTRGFYSNSDVTGSPPLLFLFLAVLEVYERGTNVEQFVTRFLLKESANQIQSLLSSVESAVDAIDEQHGQSSHQPPKVSPRVPEKRHQNTVPDYPPNNRVSAREAVRTINTASGDEHTHPDVPLG
ncbi:hypothetical protein ATANTOWER_017134 [Ataeniobius toweri]|uniref:Uncharacterized protein n=1 Tax=Ataeniobius toweri TaxID=208326 RepID=A0ABU7AGS1_9TELE|nr:hypothetical protein [Ataeniobius toweri]